MAEFDWIDRYLKPLIRAEGAYGLANDVARFADALGNPVIVTMDTMVEDIHFLPSSPPDAVAIKLVRVNVSDIVCKGAKPAEALLSVAWPKGRGERSFEQFCDGLGRELDAWNISLLGGDTVSTKGPLTVTLTLTGHCPYGEPLTRSGARVGDALMVSGEIGAGALGLRDALAESVSVHSASYLQPNLPALGIAKLIAAYASASIDISDGLVSDASHLSEESKKHLFLDLDAVPFAFSPGTVEDALALATAGDDYQCLFTVNEKSVEACLADAEARGLTLTRIGQVREGAGLSLQYARKSVPVPAVKGYQH